MKGERGETIGVWVGGGRRPSRMLCSLPPGVIPSWFIRPQKFEGDRTGRCVSGATSLSRVLICAGITIPRKYRRMSRSVFFSGRQSNWLNWWLGTISWRIMKLPREVPSCVWALGDSPACPRFCVCLMCTLRKRLMTAGQTEERKWLYSLLEIRSLSPFFFSLFVLFYPLQQSLQAPVRSSLTQPSFPLPCQLSLFLINGTLSVTWTLTTPESPLIFLRGVFCSASNKE